MTFDDAAFDPATGTTIKGNTGDLLWRRIAGALAPQAAPPIPPSEE